MISCSWKQNFGIECMTCGFQRSVLLLFEGEFLESLKMFPATIPLIATFLFCIYHVIKKVKNGHRVVVTLFSLSAILMVGNFLIKLISHTHG